MKILLIATLSLLTTACNGVDVDLQSEMDAIKIGDTERELFYSTHLKEPLFKEKFNFAGVEIQRLEFRDMKSVYAVYLASAPLTNPHVIAKSQVNQHF